MEDKMELKKMKCDWCGKDTDCSNLKDTHYWICINCALKSFIMAPVNEDEDLN